MRLAAGHTGVGLQAMTEFAAIPECRGIHGVDFSEICESASNHLEHARHMTRLQSQNYSHRVREVSLSRSLAKPQIFEAGGVSVLRPLLGFNKKHLRQTCEANFVQWEEDKSNDDASLTPRNTIRNLFGNNRLPQALQKRSLLQLAEHKREDLRFITLAGKKLIQEYDVLLLDVRSGALVVRLQKTLLLPNGKSASFLRDLAAWLLKGLAETVSPQNDVSIESLDSVSEIVFPYLRDSNAQWGSRAERTASFTAGGVQFTRIPSQSMEAGDIKHQSTQKSRRSLDPDFIWVLNRQPYSAAPKAQYIPTISASQPLSQTAPPSSESNTDLANSSQDWSPWYLWDGRYWIRVLNRTPKSLVVRAWQSHEMSSIRSSTPSNIFNTFQRLLKLTAPGKIRWTLPVIAEAGFEQEDKIFDTPPNDKANCSSPGRILAFPTLGKPGNLNIMDDNGKRNVDWEVRYKHNILQSRDEEGRRKKHDSSIVTSWYDS